VYNGTKILTLCSQGIFSRSNRTLSIIISSLTNEAEKSTTEWRKFFTSLRQLLGISELSSIFLSINSLTASLPIILKFRHSV